MADCLKALREKSADLHGYDQIQSQANLVEKLINAATIPVSQLKEALEDLFANFKETDGEIVICSHADIRGSRDCAGGPEGLGSA